MKKKTLTTDKKRTKIIWAMDPFAEGKTLQRVAARAIEALARKGGSYEIEPVYVMNSVTFDFPVDYQRELLWQIESSAQTQFDDLVQSSGRTQFKPVRVLTDAGSTTESSAEALLAYARKSKTDLIVIGTRATSGPKRWVMGSFAETLTLLSEIPLLVVNPLEKRKPSFDQIFFATDFSKRSELAFNRLVQFAKSRHASITLFHQIPADLFLGMGPEFAAIPDYQEIYKSDRKWRKSEAEAWVKLAGRSGVKVRALLEEKKGRSPAEAIIRHLKRWKGVAAVAASSGKVAAVLLGSTARAVVRGATVPVWVIHLPEPKTRQTRAEKAREEARSKNAARLHFPLGGQFYGASQNG